MDVTVKKEPGEDTHTGGSNHGNQVPKLEPKQEPPDTSSMPPGQTPMALYQINPQTGALTPAGGAVLQHPVAPGTHPTAMVIPNPNMGLTASGTPVAGVQSVAASSGYQLLPAMGQIVQGVQGGSQYQMVTPVTQSMVTPVTQSMVTPVTQSMVTPVAQSMATPATQTIMAEEHSGQNESPGVIVIAPKDESEMSRAVEHGEPITITPKEELQTPVKSTTSDVVPRPEMQLVQAVPMMANIDGKTVQVYQGMVQIPAGTAMVPVGAHMVPAVAAPHGTSGPSVDTPKNAESSAAVKQEPTAETAPVILDVRTLNTEKNIPNESSMQTDKKEPTAEPAPVIVDSRTLNTEKNISNESSMQTDKKEPTAEPAPAILDSRTLNTEKNIPNESSMQTDKKTSTDPSPTKASAPDPAPCPKKPEKQEEETTRSERPSRPKRAVVKPLPVFDDDDDDDDDYMPSSPESIDDNYNPIAPKYDSKAAKLGQERPSEETSLKLNTLKEVQGEKLPKEKPAEESSVKHNIVKDLQVEKQPVGVCSNEKAPVVEGSNTEAPKEGVSKEKGNEEKEEADLDAKAAEVNANFGENQNKSHKPEVRSLYMGLNTDGGGDWLKIIGKEIKSSQVYQCPFCPFIHKQPKEVSTHLTSDHANLAPLAEGKNTGLCHKHLFMHCRECDFVTHEKLPMWHHLEMCHGFEDVLTMKVRPLGTYEKDPQHKDAINDYRREPSTTYYCKECDYETRSKSNLIPHLRQEHKGTKFLKYSYAIIRQVDQHGMSQAQKGKTNRDSTMCTIRDCFLCTKCTFCSYRQLLVEVHSINNHSMKKLLYICNDCSDVYNNPDHLMRHQEVEHNKAKRFLCSVTLRTLDDSIKLSNPQKFLKGGATPRPPGRPGLIHSSVARGQSVKRPNQSIPVREIVAAKIAKGGAPKSVEGSGKHGAVPASGTSHPKKDGAKQAKRSQDEDDWVPNRHCEVDSKKERSTRGRLTKDSKTFLDAFKAHAGADKSTDEAVDRKTKFQVPVDPDSDSDVEMKVIATSRGAIKIPDVKLKDLRVRLVRVDD